MESAISHTVLLTDTTYQDHSIEKDIIAAANGALEVVQGPLMSHPGLGQASALMVELEQIGAEVFDHAPNLRVVARYGVGVDNVDLDEAERRGIWVTNVPGYATDSVADHWLASVLTLTRHMGHAHAAIASGDWREALTAPRSLSGCRLGLVGFGAIARAVARRAQAIGMAVQAADPLVDASSADDENVTLVTLDDVIESSDVISLHCPLSEVTRHLLGADAFARIRRGAIVVNTARGGLIDEAALLVALDQGQVSGAALDVFEHEPLPIGHPFRSHPNVVATPHMAFWSDRAEAELRRSVASSVADVLVEGHPPPDVTVVTGRTEDTHRG